MSREAHRRRLAAEAARLRAKAMGLSVVQGEGLGGESKPWWGKPVRALLIVGLWLAIGWLVRVW